MSTDGRKLALVLVNASLDSSGELNLRLRAQPADLKLLTLDGVKPLLWQQQGSDALVTVPGIGPWQTATIVSTLFEAYRLPALASEGVAVM